MAADGVKVIEAKPHTAPTDPPPPVDIDPQDSYAITTQNGIKQEGGFQGKVVQITNVSPQATLQQMATLFGFLGTVTDIQLYPSSEIQQVAVKLCYIKYENSECCAVAQHLTNTVFIDRALIVVPLEKEEIPEEGECSQLLASINAFAGMASAGFLATPGIGAGNGSFPTPPLITCTTEPTEIEEIRRTIYVNNIEEDISSEQILAFFSGVGEIKYLRFCKEAEEGKYAFLEFSNIESVPAAMQYNGVLFAGKPLKVDYAKSPIVKPESERIAAGRGGIRGAGPARKVREVSPTRDRRRSRSRSVSKASSRRRSRSRESSRRRSRKSRSRSPSRRRRTKSRSRSPVRSKSSRRRSRTRSRSPRRRRKSRSRSRSRDRRRRRRSRTRSKSRSPKRRSRSRSKGRRRKSRSRSGSRMRKRSRSKTKSRSRSKSVSKSPERKKKSRSRTPPRKKSRSRTPARKSKKSVSRSPDRKKSSKKSVSRSPERKKSSKKSVSRSPERRKSSKKSVSRSPERKRSSKKSVSRSPERKKSSKSSRKDKERDKDDRKEKSSKEKSKDKEKEKDRESDEDVSPKKKKSSDK